MGRKIKDTTSENPNLVPGQSHLSPAAMGVTVKTKIERGDAYSAPEIYDVAITLMEIVRGKEVLGRVKTQGVLDEPPKTGFEYVLARIKFGYSRRGRGLGNVTYRLTEGQFAAVSSDGKTEYKIPSVFHQPQPQLIDSVFSAGESREGWILLQVPKDEKKPRLIFKRENAEGIYGIWRSVWFQLY